MQKKWYSVFPFREGQKNLWKIMKLTIVLLIGCFMTVSANSYSQKTKLDIDLSDTTIKGLFGYIEQNSEFIFLYRSEDFNTSKKVSIDVKGASINEILDQALKGENVAYDVYERQIVIRKAEKSKVSIEQPLKKEITGTVKDSKGVPLPGVTVVIKGTTTGVITNAEGKFRLALPPDAKNMTFSFVGMKTMVVEIGKQTNFDVIMADEVSSLEEIVVIGYGSMKKSDLTGAVGEVKVNELVKAPVSSFAEALAGRVAGVQVNSSDGQPGASVNIIIRGTGSLTQSTQPLYVIDGIAIESFDPLTLNQKEIESMSVLKDASATAIYGSRGANGVILIQTKRGSIGKPVFSFSSSVGFQAVPKAKALMTPYEYVKYQNELNPTITTSKAFFGYDATLGRMRTLDDYKNVKGVNFQDYLLRTGATQIHDVSLRGGTEMTRYSMSGSIYDLTGAIINTGLKRYTGRITLDQKISEKFNAGLTVNTSVVTQNGHVVNQGQAGAGQATSYLLISAWIYRPISPLQSVDVLSDAADFGTMTTSDIRVNPFLSQQNQHVLSTTKLLDVNPYVKYNITKDLILKTTGGYRDNKYTTEAFYNHLTSLGSPYNLNNINGINGFIRNMVTTIISSSNTLNFNKSFHKHHTINALALFETISTKVATDGYTGRLLPNETLGISGIDEGTASNAVMIRSENTLASFAGRLDYNYKSRYFLTGSYRADGSSKFREHWGYFPSASMAWNMQNEPLFEKLFPSISKSKLRLGYGAVGNNRIGDFDYLSTLTFDNSTQGYPYYNQNPNGAVYLSNVGNMDLKWETVKTFDLGYELGMFKNRLTIEADLYRKTTSNLLLNATLPRSTGFISAVKNIGELRNDGLELTINTFNINRPQLQWSTNFNISFNRNKVMALTNGQQSLSSTVTYESNFNRPLYIAEVGRPSGMMIGYIWEGNYQYEDFDNPSPGVYVLKPDISGNGTLRNSIQPGDIRYKDINGDGTMTDADVTFIGRGQPIHTGGFSNNFSWKGFDLNVFFTWSYGNNIFNANRVMMEGNSAGWANINQYATYANRWSPTNPSNLYYRTRGQGPIGMFSSRTVEDGSYIKLKTVALSYSIPKNIIKKLSMSDLNLSVSAQNLYTWTHYSGLDPEVSTRGVVLTPGYDYSAYPRSPMIVFGLKAAF